MEKVGHVSDADIGHNVREYRMVRETSQASLAAALSDLGLPFTQQMILKVEKGARPLRLAEAEAIARILEIKVERLVAARLSPEEAQLHLVDEKLRRAWHDAVLSIVHFRTAIEALAHEIDDPAGIAYEMPKDQVERAIPKWRMDFVRDPFEETMRWIVTDLITKIDAESLPLRWQPNG